MYFCKKIALLIRISHIILAIAVFFSSTGIVLNKHYCQEELKSMAFFVDAKPCHQAKKMAACPMHQQMDHQQKKEQKGCCDDQTELIQFDLDQFSYSFAFDADLNPDFFPAFVSAFYTDPISTDLQTVEFLNYRPPLIVLDLPVRFQTFLC